jgi:hypothetical protein
MNITHSQNINNLYNTKTKEFEHSKMTIQGIAQEIKYED